MSLHECVIETEPRTAVMHGGEVVLLSVRDTESAEPMEVLVWDEPLGSMAAHLKAGDVVVIRADVRQAEPRRVDAEAIYRPLINPTPERTEMPY